MLNHMVLLTVDEGTASYLEYRDGTVVADRLMRQFDRTVPHEHDTEMLAMFLHRCIVAHDQDAPSYAQQLYGHRS